MHCFTREDYKSRSVGLRLEDILGRHVASRLASSILLSNQLAFLPLVMSRSVMTSFSRPSPARRIQSRGGLHLTRSTTFGAPSLREHRFLKYHLTTTITLTPPPLLSATTSSKHEPEIEDEAAVENNQRRNKAAPTTKNLPQKRTRSNQLKLQTHLPLSLLLPNLNPVLYPALSHIDHSNSHPPRRYPKEEVHCQS